MLFKYFFEVGTHPKSETLPVLDLSRCTTGILTITEATPVIQSDDYGRAKNERLHRWHNEEATLRPIIQQGDVLRRPKASWLYVNKVTTEVTIPAHVTIFRKGANSDDGFPAYLLPYYVYERKELWKDYQINDILSAKVDTIPKPPVNGEKLLENSEKMTKLTMQKVTLLEERTLTLGLRMLWNLPIS